MSEMPWQGNVVDDEQYLDQTDVYKFAGLMIDNLTKNRAKGRHGWRTCPVKNLYNEAYAHFEKFDWLSLAILSMMLYFRHNPSLEKDHKHIFSSEFIDTYISSTEWTNHRLLQLQCACGEQRAVDSFAIQKNIYPKRRVTPYIPMVELL